MQTCFITEPKAQDHLQKCNKGISDEPLEPGFGVKNKELRHLLECMLQFNPYFRPSAKELLKHPFFDSVRDSNMEKVKPSRIVLLCDKDENYDSTAKKFKMSKPFLRKQIREVMSSIQMKE